MYSKGWSSKVQNSYSEKDKDSGTYDNSEWVEKQKNRIRSISEEIEVSKERNKLLIDEVEKIEKDTVSVLDLGGGFGLSYHPLRISTSKKINYNIVEVPRVVDSAASFYEGHRELFFYEKLSSFQNQVDLCYIRTSLQYFKDWKTTLEELCEKEPSRIVLCDTAAGPISTFLTYQYWGDEKIPYWFINSEELIEVIESKGYTCTQKDISQDITNNKSFEGLKKYPEKNRIKTLLNFVFEKNENK